MTYTVKYGKIGTVCVHEKKGDKMKKETLLNLKKNLLITSLIFGTSIAGINSNKIDSYAKNNTSINKEDNRIYSIDDAISYYSKVFCLDEKIIKDKLYDMTNNFHSAGWKHGYCINNTFYDSIEYAILSTIRDIYNNPEEFDLDDSIRTNEVYEPDMEIEEMIYKYSNIYGINKEVALSIVYCECGTDVNSSNYRNNNNPAGIGPSMKFLNKEVGVIYFCNMLKNNYHCKEDSGEEFLNAIASTYCEIPGHWLNLTLPNYHKLQEDYLYYIDDDEKDNYDVTSYDDKKLTLN